MGHYYVHSGLGSVVLWVSNKELATPVLTPFRFSKVLPQRKWAYIWCKVLTICWTRHQLDSFKLL